MEISQDTFCGCIAIESNDKSLQLKKISEHSFFGNVYDLGIFVKADDHFFEGHYINTNYYSCSK